MPSTLAVTVTVPVPQVCSTPLADTGKTWGFSLTQVAVLPGSVLPAASFAVTASCTVSPS